MNAEVLKLIEDYIDGRLDQAGADRLSDLLENDAHARAYLRSLGTFDTEMRDLAFAPPELHDRQLYNGLAVTANQTSGSNHTSPRGRGIRGLFKPHILLVAAAVIAGIAIILTLSAINDKQALEHVATIEKMSRDLNSVPALVAGARLTRDPIEIGAGILQLRFDSGARISLHGPARFVPIDERGGILQHGALVGKAPEDHRGLRIVGPNFEVNDLGTEFALAVNNAQGSELYVIEGSVALKAQGSEQITVKKDNGYHIDLQNQATVLDEKKIKDVFGKILVAQRDPLGIITPDTVALFSFAGDTQDQWREVITNTPIRADVAVDPQHSLSGLSGENSDMARATIPSELNIDSPLSFEALIYIEPHVAKKSGETEGYLFSVENGVKTNVAGWGVYINRQSDGFFSPVFTHYFVKDYVFPQVKLPQGRWVHVMFTVDESMARFYMDGALQGESARDGHMRMNKNMELLIAGKILKARKSKIVIGQIAYIAVHRRVLSANDIKNRITTEFTP